MTPATRIIDHLRLKDATFSNPRSISGLARDEIIELAAGIGFYGLLTPLLVTETGLVIAGQRRYLAIRMLLEWYEAQHEGRYHDLEECLTDPDVQVSINTAARELWRKHAQELREGIPVRVVAPEADLEGVALADNMQRKDMSSYEIAARLAHLHEQGATGANLARMSGKSKSWVSRKLSAWAGAGAVLREAWKAGLPDDAVQQLAELPAASQERRLAMGVRAVRGPANRPGIDTIKAVLADLEKRPGMAIYAIGIRDALRWVVGRPVSKSFLDHINEDLTE